MKKFKVHRYSQAENDSLLKDIPRGMSVKEFIQHFKEKHPGCNASFHAIAQHRSVLLKKLKKNPYGKRVVPTLKVQKVMVEVEPTVKKPTTYTLNVNGVKIETTIPNITVNGVRIGLS